MKVVSRPEAISLLREHLKALAGQDHCVCQVVGELGIFCKGFKGLPDKDLKERFGWISRHNPGSGREKLEQLASLYHQGRQEATGAEICCDVETREHVGCDGWNSFDNTALERFHLTLTGQPLRIK